MILFCASGILLVFEVIKEVVLTYNNGAGWRYTWWTFPFQPCSICMYAAFAAACMSDKYKRARNRLYIFLATYGIFCGLSAMIIPTDIFKTYTAVFVLFQSMFHHGMLILIGVYLIASGRVQLGNKNFLKGAAVFTAACLIAIPLDIIIYKFVTADIFNMMYVSPYFECTLPVVDLVARNVPYIVYLPVYFAAFGLCAFIVMYIAIGIKKLIFHSQKITR